jgi:hypothetical protein
VEGRGNCHDTTSARSWKLAGGKSENLRRICGNSQIGTGGQIENLYRKTKGVRKRYPPTKK